MKYCEDIECPNLVVKLMMPLIVFGFCKSAPHPSLYGRGCKTLLGACNTQSMPTEIQIRTNNAIA